MIKKDNKITISQKDHYTGNFGMVLRGSAIFYAANDDDIKTTISFIDYWKLKRGLNVAIVTNIRRMDGSLIERKLLQFVDGMVINFCPDYNFEGSIEIEVFSLENMVIPFSAFMAVYETEQSISMVHSYARIYSPHEIEEGRVITKGRESCWTIRDSQEVQSFCVMHNGALTQNEQIANIVITLSDNKRYFYSISIPELSAYATYRINLAEYIDNLVEILDGKSANASINFEVKGAFTRLLVGNESKETKEIQVTHSNFNYQKHETDLCEDQNENAYMHLVEMTGIDLNAIVYPDMVEGSYSVTDGDDTLEFNSSERLEFRPITDTLSFSRSGGRLPTRIVTSITGGHDNKLPFECSLGVFHKGHPLKRMHWGIASISENLKGSLFITALSEIHGKIKDEKFIVRLYSQISFEYIEITLNSSEINDFQSGVLFSDIFTEGGVFLSNRFGYYTVYSEYGGLVVYSSIEKSNSVTIEHSF